MILLTIKMIIVGKEIMLSRGHTKKVDGIATQEEMNLAIQVGHDVRKIIEATTDKEMTYSELVFDGPAKANPDFPSTQTE